MCLFLFDFGCIIVEIVLFFYFSMSYTVYTKHIYCYASNLVIWLKFNFYIRKDFFTSTVEVAFVHILGNEIDEKIFFCCTGIFVEEVVCIEFCTKFLN